jgi:fatty acid desaturase
MNDIPEADHAAGTTHTVRPRWAWMALLVMVVGLVLIGAGIIVQSWTWAVPGLVILVAGGLAGIYGGFFYDVQGGASVDRQLHDVAEGNEHEFPDAAVTRSEDEVKRDVRRRWLGRKA